MPRRPRPLSRQRVSQSAPIKGSNVSSMRRALPSEGDAQESNSSTSENSAHEAYVSDEENILDASRFAQWVDDDDLGDDVENDEQEGSSSNPKTLRRNIYEVSLGALRKAHNILAHVDSDESNQSEIEEDAEADFQKERYKAGVEARKKIAKRANKHAPIEVTSKRPVTRKRSVIDVPAVKSRDPRFLPLAGEFSATKFQKSYDFLSQKHQQELGTLRENLKRAKKLLSSSPQNTYEELANEVGRLELAVKRAESLVNKDKKDAVEQAALAKMGREEREKRKQGKGAWYLKKSSKREVLMKARYEALSSEGGTRAVKKAVEKKQRKIGQKEKRSRPYFKDGDGGRNKRRRVV